MSKNDSMTFKFQKRSFDLFFLISTSTFFVQPLFVPLAYERLGYSIVQSSLLFGLVVGISGIIQYWFSHLIENRKIHACAALVFGLVVACLSFTESPVNYLLILCASIILATIGRTTASVVKEVLPENRSVKNSMNFYVIANAGLVISSILAFLLIEKIPIYLIFIDMFTTLALIAYSLVIISKHKRPVSKPFKNKSSNNGFLDIEIIGVILMHCGCMVQFGIMPILFSQLNESVLSGQKLFNLTQSIVVIIAGTYIIKSSARPSTRNCMIFGVAVLTFGSIFLPYFLSLSNFGIILLGSIWGLGTTYIAPACSSLVIEKIGIKGTGLNILIIRISMMLSVLIPAFAAMESFSILNLQILSICLPTAGLIAVLYPPVSKKMTKA